jgi:hypothetical protein
MSATLISIFVWVLFMTVQSLMTSDFLRILEIENREKYLEIDPDREQFWNHLQPLRISLCYILLGAYKSWGLGSAAQRSALRLRLVSFAGLLSFCVVLGVAIIEYV